MNRSAGKSTSKVAKQQKSQKKTVQKAQKKTLTTKKPTAVKKSKHSRPVMSAMKRRFAQMTDPNAPDFDYKGYSAVIEELSGMAETELAEAGVEMDMEMSGDAVAHPWLTTPDYPLSGKLTTSISGLPAIPNGRHVLDNLLANTILLSKQKQRAEPNNFLWAAIENNALFRLQTLRKFSTDDHMVERVIGAGQIEDLIEQQEEELTLFQTIKPKKQFDPESFRGQAPGFGSEDPRCETQIFPLPEEVALEVASGKVTINPYHPTKRLSRKFVQHIGFGDKITPEMHAEYDQLMALTEDEVAKQKQNMLDVMSIVYEDASVNFISKKKDSAIDAKFFDAFSESTYVFPELDKVFVNNWKEAHETHTRKL